ncbi:MAG: hypothetical protein K9J17_09180 [Flavobacteriales bacterium]|nr:hypothetical protein [Flavobacteriales bacterium]
MRALIYTIISITLFACGSETDVLTPVVGPANSHFRGNTIGDKYQQVLKNAATDHPVPTEEGVLNCEFKAGDSELTVHYEFDQEKLYSVQADMFFPDSASLNTFENKLVERYNASFGEVQLDGGFLVWKDNSSGTEVEFTLADESIEFGQPKLSLTIYNFDY